MNNEAAAVSGGVGASARRPKAEVIAGEVVVDRLGVALWRVMGCRQLPDMPPVMAQASSLMCVRGVGFGVWAA